MKPAPKSRPELAPLLAFGAHPDDIEFGCGGVIAKETKTGRPAHFVVCSRGESASHGKPAQRILEANRSAKLLGASIRFVELDGDAHLEVRAEHAIKLAGIIRRLRPGIVLRRAWRKTSIRIMHGSDNWFATPAASRVMAASRNCVKLQPMSLNNYFITP